MTITAIAPTVPTTDAEAIAFALDHLDAFEVADFLADWCEGKDPKPWLDAWHQDRQGG
ncbi:hypothetical protein FQ775_24115 [Nitratireductor mangrovi]|uniref:Uncharacterized protein n=1 Tax=Nitratireductor mangrovi TaxID=2599600 RepID=A0A6H0DY03_9HYPH|nr:hypothetical protein [Nitratireductor mangrovi]QIS94678.1 hypothetical protein FQ775_24115 [Nitratireductor mangrovi]